MCQVTFNVDCKLGSWGLKYHNVLSTLLCLCVAGATIFLGGLASLQNECYDDGSYAGNTDGLAGVNGFSAQAHTCKKIFRYYWFIAAFEFVVAFFGIYAVCLKSKFASLKGSLLGLFVVATLLFIATSDAFLGLIEVPLFQSETLRDRSKTAVAGAIITATLNAAVVFVSGYDA
ncbi:hypothetical protein GPECTOR_2g1082 [Gonium pectorale]|uniref:CASP-like protein n=1 Tax=Gonium pectorale TaxID=33097 RepID=A0A150H0K7_GONPE|nr:hypothetical protein GPECTOR_2g1082 [Gonium pectorale]|eukprot:KXZ55533.1 hypothetical protein GPECTOR_2g1082 [Gonium pectorale]